jgi:hypothetical protein
VGYGDQENRRIVAGDLEVKAGGVSWVKLCSAPLDVEQVRVLFGRLVGGAGFVGASASRVGYVAIVGFAGFAVDGHAEGRS